MPKGVNKPPFQTLIEVDSVSGCWNWMGYIAKDGYGQYGGRRAHRVSWELTHGPIPEGMSALHKCGEQTNTPDNKQCVNPAHLYLGTPADNGKDMSIRGRVVRGQNVAFSKLSPAVVEELRRRHAAGASCPALAKEVGVTRRAAMQAIRGFTWKHIKTPVSLRDTKPPPRSGVPGVSWDNHGQQWRARRSLSNGRRLSLGRFDTIAEAERALRE